MDIRKITHCPQCSQDNIDSSSSHKTYLDFAYNDIRVSSIRYTYLLLIDYTCIHMDVTVMGKFMYADIYIYAGYVDLSIHNSDIINNIIVIFGLVSVICY